MLACAGVGVGFGFGSGVGVGLGDGLPGGVGPVAGGVGALLPFIVRETEGEVAVCPF